jgi:hypothetical protein
MSDEEIDPRFCCFCQDAPPTGALLLVEQYTQTLVGRSELRACNRCGLNYTDSVFGHNEKTGVVAVVQFEHDDFQKLDVDTAVESFVQQINDLRCHVCAVEIEWKSPLTKRDYAVKVLRQAPSADSMTMSCETCGCPCCGESTS